MSFSLLIFYCLQISKIKQALSFVLSTLKSRLNRKYNFIWKGRNITDYLKGMYANQMRIYGMQLATVFYPSVFTTTIKYIYNTTCTHTCMITCLHICKKMFFLSYHIYQNSILWQKLDKNEQKKRRRLCDIALKLLSLF